MAGGCRQCPQSVTIDADRQHLGTIPVGVSTKYFKRVFACIVKQRFTGSPLHGHFSKPWVYQTMESIGDTSENPFQGMASDIPMFSLCRTIEIDLREMLGETDLPQAVVAKKGVLM